jgi:hypothetical protein
LNDDTRVITVKAAAEVQKQVRLTNDLVVSEWGKNQVYFWTRDGLGSCA